MALFSGVSVYKAMIGSPPVYIEVAYNIAFSACILLVLRTGGSRLVRCRARKPIALFIGTTVAVLGFFAIAGPEAAGPPFERYALWLVAPIILGFSLSAAALAKVEGNQRRVLWVSVIGAALSLITVWTSYFQPMLDSGGDSHRTYRTGPIELKLLAFRTAWSDAPDVGSPKILAEDWWLYWPIRYLALDLPGATIQQLPDDPVLATEEMTRSFEAGYSLIGFSGGPIEQAVGARYKSQDYIVSTIEDGGGRPRIIVIRKRSL
jgi:hypothetical protein